MMWGGLVATMTQPSAKRARRECSLCQRTYLKLSDHLNRKHNLSTWEPYMEEAMRKMPVSSRSVSCYYIILFRETGSGRSQEVCGIWHTIHDLGTAPGRCMLLNLTVIIH